LKKAQNIISFYKKKPADFACSHTQRTILNYFVNR